MKFRSKTGGPLWTVAVNQFREQEPRKKDIFSLEHRDKLYLVSTFSAGSGEKTARLSLFNFNPLFRERLGNC